MGGRVVLTLWENGSFVGVSSHESDGIVEKAVIVNPTSSAPPSYEAIREREPSRISSAEACACGYGKGRAYAHLEQPLSTYQHMRRIGEGTLRNVPRIR